MSDETLPASNPQEPPRLRRGWTTGACATAALKAALEAFWGPGFPPSVRIELPKGETPSFLLAHQKSGPDWAEAGVEKDAGDDPDVTHGALIIVRVSRAREGIEFRAGAGVGRITRPGLPIAVGEAAINPVPRQMMQGIVEAQARKFGQSPDVVIEVSVPGGQELAKKTWNPRLGIEGGISILGTTGIVRPFSCAAWIASIHRGIDVARAAGLSHVAGCTGATSERVVQNRFDLPDHAMLDMGDFAGGLLKYLRKHPIERITIGGGIGKMTKLAQGARDLHSKRSQVDLEHVARWLSGISSVDVRNMNTAMEVSENIAEFAPIVAEKAARNVAGFLEGAPIRADVVVINRDGKILAEASA